MPIKTIFCLFFLFFSPILHAESPEAETVVEYEKMGFLEVFTRIPESSFTFLKRSFSKEALWPWAAITSSTVLFYVYDEEMLLEVQRWGRKWGLGNDDNTRTQISIGELDIFRGPTDLGSSLYFLGDGWLHIGLAASFAGIGQLGSSNRLYNSGLQMLHGMIVSTIFNQFLKRTTGRESPFVRTQPRGKWRPFPSISEYNNRVPKYDAFPSGHVMTATTTFTILIENFPEYRHILFPLECVWVSLLGLQMMNNGVHWASDYPLGIAMGYLTGKIVTQYGKKDKQQALQISPVFPERQMAFQIRYSF